MFFKWNFNNLNLYLQQTQILKDLWTNTFPFSKTKIQSGKTKFNKKYWKGQYYTTTIIKIKINIRFD